MAATTLNRFAKFYNAEILRRSGANSRLGDLYDWAGLFNQRLVPVNANAIDFVQADAAERVKWRAAVDAAPKFAANFADVIDLTSSLEVGVKADLPNVPVNLAADLATKKVLSFQFEKVVQRTMPEEMGIELRLLLEDFKAQHAGDYRRHLRPYDLALVLYYAESVVLRVDTTTQIDAAATAEVTKLGGSVKVDASGHQELRFDQSDSPFAVTLRATQSY